MLGQQMSIFSFLCNQGNCPAQSHSLLEVQLMQKKIGKNNAFSKSASYRAAHAELQLHKV
jgi:hypothetical protein